MPASWAPLQSRWIPLILIKGVAWGYAVTDGSDFEALINAAHAGHVPSQRNLAVRYHSGDGVLQDAALALTWLKRAAEGQDPWAQTTYGILLRSSGDADNQRESVRWLRLAAEQNDGRAHLNLAIQLMQGIGTQVDPSDAAEHAITAAFLGEGEAQKMLLPLRRALPDGVWRTVFDRIEWPSLTLYLGPPAHLEEMTGGGIVGSSKPSDQWVEYERAVANVIVGPAATPDIWEMAFGEAAQVTEYFVAMGVHHGSWCSCITISLEHICGADGLPLLKLPDGEGMDAMMATWGTGGIRKFVGWDLTV